MNLPLTILITIIYVFGCCGFVYLYKEKRRLSLKDKPEPFCRRQENDPQSHEDKK